MHESIDLTLVDVDDALLARAGVVEQMSLVAVAIVAAVVLLGWICPPVASLLPSGWTAMKANTALAAGLSVLSLAFSHSRRGSSRYFAMSQVLGIIVTLFAAAVVSEYVFQVSFGVDTLLAADRGAVHPGRMSPQTATAFLLLGIELTFVRSRKKFVGLLVDLAALCLCLLVVLIASGYLFGGLRLFGLSMGNRVSLQTLSCLTLLAFVVLLRRSEGGFYSILWGVGLGSRMARLVCPAALLFPFLLEIVRVNLVRRGIVGDNYATALATSVAAVCAFGLVLVLAWRIDGLEKQILELSLRDDLTKLYNRKGFFAHAGRSLKSTKSAGKSFSVLFIDMDNLKLINDAAGHHVGSVYLREMAMLLTKSFRRTDVIGRIGGDEFVVACQCSEIEILTAAKRLEISAASFNVGLEYPLSFSFGHATSSHSYCESLDEMLGIADASMYTVKKRKKLGFVNTMDRRLIEQHTLNHPL